MSNDNVQPLRARKQSLASQAQHYLLDLVEAGTYQPGAQLPSEKELAARLGISRPTLREALQNLEQEGVVVRKHGVGTFVAPGYEDRLKSGLERLESVMELASRQHLAVKVESLEIGQEPAGPELAARLRVAPGTLLTRVSWAIAVDGRPVAYMVDYALSSVLSPGDVGEPFGGSVLDLLRDKPDLQVAQAQADIVAVNADRGLAGKLNARAGQALLLLEETLFDAHGAALDFSRNYFVPDFFQFHVLRR